MSTTSLSQSSSKGYLKFKCPDCPMKFLTLESLVDHIEENHKNLIPDNVTIRQYIFNKKYKKIGGQCVVDKKPTPWNEEKLHYERYCSTKCREKARKIFKKNCRRKLGTDNPAESAEHQIKAIKGRSYSGEYTFTDKGVIGYSSSYEKDFLEFIDKELNINSSEVEQCEIIFEIYFDGKKHFHIPDYYLPSFNLIVNIKESTNNNPNVAINGHLRQRLADASIITNGNYNYIKIVDKEYGSFVNMIEIIKNKQLSTEISSKNIIISIPM